MKKFKEYEKYLLFADAVRTCKLFWKKVWQKTLHYAFGM